MGGTAWTIDQLNALREELRPFGTWVAPADVASVLGKLVSRRESGETDLVPAHLERSMWLQVVQQLELQRDPVDGRIEVVRLLLQLALEEWPSEVELRTAHAALSADEAFPDQVMDADAIATLLPAELASWVRELLGEEACTARRILTVLATAPGVEDAARRLLAAFTGQGVEPEEPEVPAEPAAKGKKGAEVVAEKPPLWSAMTLNAISAIFCQRELRGGAALTDDWSQEQLASLFGVDLDAETDAEVPVDLAKLPWHVFLADGRVRRFLVRPPLALG